MRNLGLLPRASALPRPKRRPTVTLSATSKRYRSGMPCRRRTEELAACYDAKRLGSAEDAAARGKRTSRPSPSTRTTKTAMQRRKTTLVTKKKCGGFGSAGSKWSSGSLSTTTTRTRTKTKKPVMAQRRVNDRRLGGRSAEREARRPTRCRVLRLEYRSRHSGMAAQRGNISLRFFGSECFSSS